MGTLQPGEALFFPPGFVHETLNLDTAVGSCSASVTFQFNAPKATRLYRRFLPRVRRTADIHEAWPLLEQWASLHSSSPPKDGLRYKDAKAQAFDKTKGVGLIFTRVDKDASDSLSASELQAAF